MSEPQIQFRFRCLRSRQSADECSQSLTDKLRVSWLQVVEHVALRRTGVGRARTIIPGGFSILAAIQAWWRSQRIEFNEKVDVLIALARGKQVSMMPPLRGIAGP